MIALVASSISRKRALTFLNSRFLHRLTASKKFIFRRLPGSETKLKEKYDFVVCLPVGERPAGYQLLLLGQAPLSRTQEVFLRLVRNIIISRYEETLAQDQLRREAENLTTLTHHLSEGMAVLDHDLKVTLWNRPMQRVTGYSPREAIGKPYDKVFRRIDSQDWLRDLIKTYYSSPVRHVFNTEFEIQARDGTKRWVDVSGSFMRHNQDQVHQIVIIVRDASASKLEEERKNEFISIATHELRTPITAIKGYLSLLSRDGSKLSPKQRAYLQRAIDANNRLVGLAEDLLRTVQVEEDRMRLNIRPVNLADTLGKVSRDLRQKAKAKKIRLEYKRPHFEAWVAVDEEKTEQIFANLVDNAIKYTHHGEVRVHMVQVEENGEPHIIVHVQDSGIGISPKNYETIFEKFRRTHDTAQIRESGAGLGLFIVKSFVEKQGGKISVTSKIGKGTTFSVSFPVTESPKLKDEKGVDENE
jgi:two-component system phosphate regulon sensor histidine kinase PhoR